MFGKRDTGLDLSPESTTTGSENDIELGISEALERHVTRHVVHAKPVTQRKLDFEHRRPRILRECMAEATGVFFYVFAGITSVAAFTLNLNSPIGVAPFGSLFQIGWAFAVGIAFAIMLCAPTSGGHFNPAITLCFAIWSGFPWKKVPHYIFSQIVGAFVAGMVLMGCYWPMIAAEKNKVLAAGHGDRTPFFETGGLATILCPFPANGQTNLGYIFFQEFFIDSYIGLVIWGSLDPANPFVTPVSVPFTIGIAYASMIWGVGANTISTNLARDLGTRFVAAIFFGPQAFTYDHYPWISVLVNIPATIFATGYYEFLLRDSLQKIHKGHAEHEAGEAGLIKHITKVAEPGIIVSADKDDDDDGAALATSTGRATGDAKADMRSPVRGEKDDDTLNSGHTLSHEQY